MIMAECVSILKTFPDHHFDVAIVDPPYGIGENARKAMTRGCKAKVNDWGSSNSDWDKEPPSEEYFRELFRVSKHQIIWGANHFMHRICRGSSCWVVWDKDNGNTDFADCELAYTSFKTSVRKFRYKWQGMIQENMKEKERRIHPTQKPVKLYEWLLMNYAKPGQNILDTHLGSGSIAIACHNLGFELTGIEIDPEYYKAAKTRLINHQSQGTLF